MARVIGFVKPKEFKKYKTVCPMCNAVIEYTKEEDIHDTQMGDYYLTCPNCNKKFTVLEDFSK